MREAGRGGLRADVKLLFQSALAVGALSVLLGMLDGQGRVDLGPRLALVHGHAGTLGWITLGVIALALMLFGGTAYHAPSPLELRLARAVSVLGALGVPCEVLALGSGNTAAGALLGVLLLLALVLLVGWLGMRCVQMPLGVAHLALLLAVVALIFGATVGVLLEIQAASGRLLFRSETAAVHPAVLLSGYLSLAGLALVEWRLVARSPRPLLLAKRAWLGAGLAIAQMVLPFLGAAALTLGMLLSLGALTLVSLVCTAAGAAIFVARVAPCVARTAWLARGSQRHYALGAVFLVASAALFVYAAGALSAHVYSRFVDVPGPILTTLDHLLVVGVLSNLLFALLHDLTWEGVGFWPATEDVLFWGMNVGLLGFVLALLLHRAVLTPLLEGIFTPLLGASMLVALVAYSVRLRRVEVRIEAAQALPLRHS